MKLDDAFTLGKGGLFPGALLEHSGAGAVTGIGFTFGEYNYHYIYCIKIKIIIFTYLNCSVN